MDKEDNIRDPDQVKIESLIDNIEFIWDANHELNTAIEISKNEFNLLREQKQRERQNIFRNIKIRLNKIISFDKANLYYYELILSIIEMYELSIIDEYKTPEKEYNNVFKFLQLIRLSNDEMDHLKKIISCE